MSDQDSVRMKNPLLLIGIGGVGTWATASNNNLGYDCLLISNDRRDLTSDNCDSVFIDSQPWVNPSSHKIRFGIAIRAKIRSSLGATPR